MRDLLIFLHVPKTGGTSLERALIERLGPEAVLRFSRASRTSAEIGDELTALSPAERERVQLLTGHQIWVGIDRFFPERRPRYITWLRDPVARLLANYWKIRRTPQHQLHGRLTALDPQEGLVEFLRGDLTPVVRNHMTVFLGRQGTAGGHDPALCQDWNRELLERDLEQLTAAATREGASKSTCSTMCGRCGAPDWCLPHWAGATPTWRRCGGGSRRRWRSCAPSGS